MAMFEVDEQVLENVRRSFTIPSCPELLIQLQAHLNSPDPDIHYVAELVSKDVGIAAGVLKLVNSAAFGLPRRVVDIKQSAIFIGLSGIYSVVTGLSLKQSYRADQCCISLDKFWDRAALVAQIAMHIGGKYKDILSLEEIYTAALFQDCGIPAMALKYRDYYALFGQSEYDSQYSLAELEEYAYKTNHAVVGYFISSTWQLPRHICQHVLLHHDRRFFDTQRSVEQKLLFAIIKMAENIVNQHYCCIDLADWSEFKAPVFEVFAIDDDGYADIVDGVEHFFSVF